MTSAPTDPRFSVIIPCFNAEQWIAETIESVLAQSCRDWELLVIDDGSADRSPEVAQSFADRDSRIRLVRKANGGVSAARNRGVAEARGPLIAFLDADDLWDPSFLQALSEMLDRHPECLGCACGFHILSEQQVLRVGPLLPGARDVISAIEILERPPWVVHAALIRKDAFVRAGGFDEALSTIEDWDIWLKLLALGDFCAVRRPLATYRFHTGQSSKNHVRMASAVLPVARRFHRLHPQVIEAYGVRAFYRNASRIIHLHAAKALEGGERATALRLTLLALRVSPMCPAVYRDSAVLWFPDALTRLAVKLKRMFRGAEPAQPQ